MNKSTQEYKGVFSWLLLCFLAIIWGSSFILIKKGLVGLSEYQVGALRIFSAGLVLSPFAVAPIKGLKRNDLALLFISGFVGSLVPAFLFAIAQTHLDSSITGVLNALTPTSVFLIGVLFYNQRAQRMKYLGLIVSLVGSVLLILTRSGHGIGGFSTYAFFVILATICYGINVNLIKYKISHIRTIHITSVSLFFTGVIAGIYLFVFTDFLQMIVTSDPKFVSSSIYIVILGFIGTAFALLLFNQLVKISTPVFSSSVTYLIPIVAVVWGVVDNEILLVGHYIGMSLIIAGILLVNKT